MALLGNLAPVPSIPREFPDPPNLNSLRACAGELCFELGHPLGQLIDLLLQLFEADKAG